MTVFRERFYQGCVSKVLPISLLALLTGMLWVGDRSLYHKLYYAGMVLPTVLCLLARPASFTALWREPLLVLYSVFGLYTMVTLSWSPEPDAYSKLKHPLYILFLFLALGALAQCCMRRLVWSVALAALLSIGFALMTLALYWWQGTWPKRLGGMGALYNPLLTSHVYGFFAALWLAALALNPQRWWWKSPALAVLLVLLFLTGSRTPFMALAACFCWLLLAINNRRVALILLVLALLLGFGLACFESTLLARGFSYRPLIWQEAWRQIGEAFWFGHGYDADMRVVVDGLARPLSDPHNLTLGVMYQTGVVGVALWLLLYGYCFWQAWRMRRHGLVIITSTLLVYGFVAGMTEGSSFMSRPKEHWFLIWLPMALHFAALLRLGRTSSPQRSEHNH